MIVLKNIRKTYQLGDNSVDALKGIDLSIAPGEFVAVQGSSGSGKSTLLNVLGILDSFDGGSYTLEGESMADLGQREAARYRNRFIGFVFQSFNLIHHKTALENVALPLYYQGEPRRQRNELAMEYLERVGLSERAEHKPAELSGGQAQRVAIARALVAKPVLLLADEPTGALDSQTSAQIMSLFRQINEEGVTVLIVTHEEEVATQTRRIVHLSDGHIASDQTNNPAETDQ